MQYSINATHRVLGRIASEVANILRGKNNPAFDPSRVGGDTVVVYHTDKLRATGRKMTQKSYYHHSGFPGGIREEKLGHLMARDSRLVLKRAVMGMLPKNKLREKMIKQLILIKGESNERVLPANLRVGR